MKHRARRIGHGGFTLIEMLIVIVIIAILALFIIPRFVVVTRRSKESGLSANLIQLRKAIAQFGSDTGANPSVLQDVVAADSAQLDAGNSAQVMQLYQGPYLAPSLGIPGYPGLPINPFQAPTDANIADHWVYDNTTGDVSSAVSGTTLDGIPYSSL